jgi:hypothetical protein
MANDRGLYPNSMDTRVALLEQSISHINQTLIRIEQDGKEFRQDVKEFKRDVKNDFRWVIGLMTAFGSGLLGTMAHGFHWI